MGARVFNLEVVKPSPAADGARHGGHARVVMIKGE